ncbi:alkaline phosphatase family protein [Romeria aff. gracilis LEGE 07310]|uniref:Alkaline phosphatase family protein n=1 Tax=Vasconcelosia minhoensis LEGE 07310 TaxID=915328 RepID=A0A8J7AQN3_9CYAN|nr:alkaline phosphatase family protein [Romeria gracilis]MBE9079290.1 alkaline phosphatase family protein [Romeria aff. gracilis LEGE 07310]
MAADFFQPDRSAAEKSISSASRYLLLFLDGLGLGSAHSANPLTSPAAMPFLTALLDGLLLGGLRVDQSGLLAKPIDAKLGVDGLPQSATGQTTLYTGQNAPKFLNRHQAGFANGSLRQLIDGYGLFKQLLSLGYTATLANLYSPAYFEAIATRRLRYSVCTLLNMTAGLPFRMQSEYEQETAIFWDITGERAQGRGIAQPPITPKEAGWRLAMLTKAHTLTLFECYLTDYAGHAQDRAQADQYLQRIDRFIESMVQSLPPAVTLIITSDHGNVEDLSTKRHTLNPVPLIAIGPQAQAFARVTDLTGITPTLLLHLPAASS